MAGRAMHGHMRAMKDALAIADTARTPPDYELHIDPQTPGRYRLWLQFRGGKTLYVAPFVIEVR